MTYIYLNTYRGKGLVYYYVGSHTWDGEGLDPEYIGSSSVANRYGWIPDRIELIEVVTDKTLRRERYWIELYAEKYGIADCVSHNKWTNRYKPHGQLLNGHANEASQMMTKEAIQKAMETRKQTGVLEMTIRTLVEADHSAAYTEEAMKKRTDTVKKKGTKCYTAEVYKRRADTIHERAKTDKTFRKKKIVRVTGEGIDETGILHQICVKLGHPTWDTTIVQKFKKSSTVTHRGYKFEWLNRIEN